MAFSQATMTGEPTVKPLGRQVLVSWVSTSPAGTMFQVYVDRALAWHGTARQAHLPYPRDVIEVQVGAVGPTEGAVDFSSSLTAIIPPTRVLLQWDGGTYLGADLAGFRVYSSASPGGAVDYSNALATIPATVAGVHLGGWGVGGWGAGGWGSSAGSYSWTSGRLKGGDWTFAVVPFDTAGNATGSPTTRTVTIAPVPNPPAPDPVTGARLSYTYNSSTRVPTLHWLASP